MNLTLTWLKSDTREITTKAGILSWNSQALTRPHTYLSVVDNLENQNAQLIVIFQMVLKFTLN